MRLDIRLPMGLMFAIEGAIICIFGLVSPASLYRRSLGININLWWGLAMLLLGLFMLLLTWRAAKGGKAS